MTVLHIKNAHRRYVVTRVARTLHLAHQLAPSFTVCYRYTLKRTLKQHQRKEAAEGRRWARARSFPAVAKHRRPSPPRRASPARDSGTQTITITCRDVQEAVFSVRCVSGSQPKGVLSVSKSGSFIRRVLREKRAIAAALTCTVYTAYLRILTPVMTERHDGQIPRKTINDFYSKGKRVLREPSSLLCRNAAPTYNFFTSKSYLLLA